MTPSPFLRFTQAGRMVVQDTLLDDLRSVIAQGAKSVDELAAFLSKEMTDRGDIPGYRVGDSSTWLEVLLEYCREFAPAEGRPEYDFRPLLPLLIADGPIEATWASVRQFLLDEVGAVTGWEQFQQRFMLRDGEVVRQDDKYFIQRDGAVVAEVRGLRTKDEEEFDFLNSDASREYGRMQTLLKLVALTFIAQDYRMHPGAYPESMHCVLPEGSQQMWFTHWRWVRDEPHKGRAVPWRPSTTYCDPLWLASDLLAAYAAAKNLPSIRTAAQPDAPSTFERWEQAFAQVAGQYEVALNTYVVIGNEAETYFDFEGLQLRWINGNDYLAPLLVVPVRDRSQYTHEMELAGRFLSQLSYQLNIAIADITSVGAPKRFRPMLQQPRHFGGIRFEDARFVEMPNLTKRQRFALALYREGLNSPSPLYAFLNFYKIVEIASEPKGPDEWINARLNPQRLYGLQEWLRGLPPARTGGEYLREANRNAIAHVEEILRSGDPTIDPDDLSQGVSVIRSVEIIKQLARIALDSVILK